jgi:hypothetical protein
VKTSPLYPRPHRLANTFDRLPLLAAALPLARRSDTDKAEASSLLDLIPEVLHNRVVTVSLEDNCLKIVVKSHEAAHATRLERPRILAAASARSYKCSEVRVRVQTRARPSAPPRPRPDSQTLAELRSTAAELKSERLQTAVQRLIRALETNG